MKTSRKFFLAAIVAVSAVSQPGSAQFASFLCGDCSGAGDLAVTVLDALAAAQLAVGLGELNPGVLNRCDTDTSGFVDVQDALRIARDAAGIAPLACPSLPITISFDFLITETVTPPSGGLPLCAGVCDVDQDADGDAVVSTTVDTAIFKNDSSIPSQPNFSEIFSLPGTSWWTFRYVDYDGDADADIVAVAHPDHDASEVRIHANQYSGPGSALSFGLLVGALPVAETVGARDADLADVDGDGDLDMFIGRGANALTPLPDRLLLSDGLGAFTLAPPATYPQALRVTSNVDFADVDDDGDADLILGFEGGGHDVYLGDGAGGFSASSGSPAPWFPAMAARATTDLAVGDLDRDGRPDVIAVASDRAAEVWHNTGTGFVLTSTYPGIVMQVSPARERQSALLLDLNGDALPELVASTNPVQLLMNFDGLNLLPVGQPWSIRAGTSNAGDINLDSKPDLIFLDPVGNVPAITLLTRS